MATKKTEVKKTAKAASKKPAVKRTPRVKTPATRAEIKKEGNLQILYVDGNRRKAFRTTEDAKRYIAKRRLND